MVDRIQGPRREIPGNFQSPGIGTQTAGLENTLDPGRNHPCRPGMDGAGSGGATPRLQSPGARVLGPGTLVQIPEIWQAQRYKSKKAVPILPRTQPSQNNRIPTRPAPPWRSACLLAVSEISRQTNPIQATFLTADNGYPPEKLPDHGNGTSRVTGYPGRVGPEQKIRQ